MNERLPETLQNIDELTQMVELHQERAPRRVLEIGVWHGGTLRQWLGHGPSIESSLIFGQKKVVAVDIAHPNLAAYRSWCALEVTVVAIHGLSQDEETIEAMRRHGPYDWIFVDGDHAYEAVLADTLNALTMLAPGGVLLLHDIAAPDDDAYGYPPGRVFHALTHLYEWEEFLSEDPSDVSHGIGVIYT